MPIHLLGTGALVYVYGWLTKDAREQVLALPKVAPWLPDLDAMLARLRAAPPGEQPSERGTAPDPEAGRALDRRVEAAVRAPYFTVLASEALAFAEGDEAAAETYTALRKFLYPNGLTFLSAAWADQVGETERLVAHSEGEWAAQVLQGVSLNGTRAAALFARVAKNNDALRAHIAPRPAAEAGPSDTPSAARFAAVALLQDFVRVVDRALPPDDPSVAATRARILEPLETRVAEADRARTAKERPAAPPAPASLTPTAPLP